jgi:RHS repeat-associated protein
VLLDFVDDDGAGPNSPELAQRYLHGPVVDQVRAQDDGAGNVLWMLADHLGTIHDLVDDAGTVANHIKYDSFGNVIEQSNPTASPRYLYTGREFDVETELYFYRARYYDANLGRFIAEDPLFSLISGPNAYWYADNSPVVFSDPWGLQTSTPYQQTVNAGNTGATPGGNTVTTHPGGGATVQTPGGETIHIPPNSSRDVGGETITTGSGGNNSSSGGGNSGSSSGTGTTVTYKYPSYKRDEKKDEKKREGELSCKLKDSKLKGSTPPLRFPINH